MSTVNINAKVNGKNICADVEGRMLLADFLRHELRLTGTHVGCEHGVCGACTIIVNGKAVRSCLMLAAQIDGKEITTVEGLSHGEELSALQKSFHKHHALQCGFCTPGLLTTVHAFLSSNNTPTSGQIRDVISGNLCRCTGYVNIVEAIEEAAEAYRGQP